MQKRGVDTGKMHPLCPGQGAQPYGLGCPVGLHAPIIFFIFSSSFAFYWVLHEPDELTRSASACGTG